MKQLPGGKQLTADWSSGMDHLSLEWFFGEPAQEEKAKSSHTRDYSIQLLEGFEFSTRGNSGLF